MKKLSFLFLIALLGASCEQVIQIDMPPHEPALVLYANAQQGDTSLQIWLSQTVDVLDQRQLDSISYLPNPDFNLGPYAYTLWVGNAQVDLYADGQLITRLQADPQRRIYHASLPSPIRTDNQRYELRITAPGFDEISAQTNLLRSPNISNLQFRPGQGRDTEGNLYDLLEFDLQDPSGQANYYEFGIRQLARDTGFFREENWAFLNSNDPSIQLSAGYLAVASDASFDGRNYRVALLCSLADTSLYQSELIVRSISRDAYLYGKSLRETENALGNPFAEPVVLYTNVQNGRGLMSFWNEVRLVFN
jgi:hypothetical protein